MEILQFSKTTGGAKTRPLAAVVILCVSALLLTLFFQILSYEMARRNAIKYEKEQLVAVVDNYIAGIDRKRDLIERVWKKEGKKYTQKEVYKLVLEEVREELHQMRYPYGGYIWINQVLDYQGGDGYAIRLVHPNLSDTEGSLLNTSTKDAKGDTPYRTELEGVRDKDGEILYSYYFKEPDSDKVSRKLTYSKLYKDYDWIICTGVYYNAVEGNSGLNSVYFRSLVAVGYALSIGGILFVMFFAMHLFRNRVSLFEDRISDLSNQVDLDPLTGAGSRAYGNRKMREMLAEFKNTGKSPLFAIMDIDHFKEFNDTYGHNFGDYVLARTVATLRQGFRRRDTIIRWGGDEFIVIYEEIKKEDAESVLDKCLGLIRGVTYQKEGHTARVTVSIGAGFLRKDDDSVETMLKRIDAALYQAKQERNAWRMSE